MLHKQLSFNSLICAVLLIPFVLSGQQKMTTEEYIDNYNEIAIEKMKEYGIPASITLAQGILESGSGNSRLATEANNHFGIKCHKDWTGKTYYMDDDEKDECFRKYDKAEESYRDHSLFLTQRDRYAFLFEYNTADYEKWAYGLKQAGYATNPKYPELLINLIVKYNLSQYDDLIGPKPKKKEKSIDTDSLPVAQNHAFPEMKEINQKGPDGRKIFELNGVKLVIAQQGETYYSIADEFELYSWQLFKYNDASNMHVPQEREIVFLEKKKCRAGKSFPNHVMKKGETLQEVSQLYGVRLNCLLRLNNMEKTARLPEGKVIKLRK